MEKVLKLKKGERIIVINSKNEGILIKNENDVLKISETKNKYANTYIKRLDSTELTSFILTVLLENNSYEIKRNKSNRKIIGKLLEDQFNKMCGTNYSGLDILSMEFQCVTHYEKNSTP